MKAYWGSGVRAPRILDLGTSVVIGQLHTPAALPPVRVYNRPHMSPVIIFLFYTQGCCIINNYFELTL
jgi:hypothetical protein